VKVRKNDAVRGMYSEPVMWPNAPTTQQEIDKLQRTILGSRLYYGSIVSLDERATMVLGGFFEHQMQPETIYRTLDEVVKRESDANTSIHVIGRPMLLGDIAAQRPVLGKIMFITTLCMLGVLAVYFRNLVGVVAPAAAALFSALRADPKSHRAC
jgi:hypothetical protein